MCELILQKNSSNRPTDDIQQIGLGSAGGVHMKEHIAVNTRFVV